MAYTKILVIHDRLDKSVKYAQNGKKTSLEVALDYALNRAKTEQTCFETAVNCDRATVYADMMETKRRWGKTDRKRKGYHIIQSFAPGEVTPEQAHAVGVELTQRLLGERYEVIVGTHLDKEHLHNHIVFNSVSFVDGLMYRDTMKDYYQGIRGTSDAVCQEHGLAVIDPEGKGKHHSEWEAEKGGKATVRGLIRQEIDTILCQSFTYKTFLQELRRRGYEVKDGLNVKHTAVRPPGSGRFIRLDSLGDGYTEADLKARLGAARRGETPVSRQEPPKSPFLTYGRRYYVRGGLLQHRPHKLTGFQALCFKYLHLLRGIKRGRPATRTAFDMRQELIKFDRYQRQFLYLHRNRIETQAQLSMQYDAIQAEIDALTDQRKELYRLYRAGDDTVTAEIKAITQQLRSLRRELRLCNQIETDSPKMEEVLKQEEFQKSNIRTPPTKIKTQEVR
ncbi:MAG: relaxase/mobilization nuclease domain-containing protein [Oscillospiraceae bacterium]|nr:relaxase/mobilization nuclease domain-containing protein [Oscillospiraceae bacterium]